MKGISLFASSLGLFGLAACATQPPASSSLRPDIRQAALSEIVDANPSERRYSIGVAGLPKDLAEVLQNDLQKSGLFRIHPQEQMPKLVGGPLEPAIVRGSVADGLMYAIVTTESDEMLRFFLFDLQNGERMLGYGLPIAKAAGRSATVHQIADLVIQKLTGTPGVANTKIAYVAAQGQGATRQYQLLVADADGQNAQIIAISREPLLSPAWSPDRRSLAYVGYDQGRSAIHVQTLADGRVRKLVSEAGINGSPAWSPDGRRIAYVLSVDGNAEIYVQDLSGVERHRVTSHPAIDTEPNWSPDGRKLLFTSDRLGQPRVFVFDIQEAGEPKLLTTEGGQTLRPSYSPDGRSVLMVVGANRRFRIASLDLATQQVRYLSDGPLDQSPSFSPDGRQVVYGAGASDRRGELAIVSFDGSVRTRLRSEVDLREPAWSPNISPN